MPRLVITIALLLLSSQLAKAQPSQSNVGSKESRRTEASQEDSSSARRGSSKQSIADAKEEQERESSSELSLDAELERARSYYQSGDYASCKEAYQDLFKHFPKTHEGVTQEEIEEGRVHYAACLFALGDKSGADTQLRSAIEDNPLMGAPDQVVFPQPFRDLFFKAKADFQDEAERELKAQLQAAKEEQQRRERQALEERRRVRRLERLAATETLVHQNRRWVAALPFGAGQFQNGDETLGAVFLTTELALLTASIVSVSRQLSIHSQADGGANVRDPDPFNNQIRTAHAVEIWAGVGFLALSAIGIIEAQLSFVEEVGIGSRRRAQPPSQRVRERASIRPTVGGLPGGASLGFGGVF